MSGMEFIAKVDVPSGGQPVVQFNTITGKYTDLLIVLSSRSTRTPQNADGFVVKLNGTTPSIRYLQGVNGSVTTGTSASGISTALGETANTFGSTTIYIPNYASTTQNKLFYVDSVAENNTVNGYVLLSANLYSSNAAVTSITIEHINANFAEYSSATLYGIKKYNTSKAPKATGGIISFDSVNNNWVHAFTASGTFTPTENLTAEYLVIAGGGGSGQDQNGGLGWGGSGAGGYRSSVAGEFSGANSSAETPLSLAASTGYTVTVGAGGPTGGGGTNGSNTTFHTIISNGGGHGAGYNLNAGGYQDPEQGGSGGGGSYNRTTGASGTGFQGLAGGNVLSGEGGGGGGGAGSVGSNASGPGADGGDGIASSITGSSIYRAGGGGGGGDNATGSAGGQGGLGGGGRGGTAYTTDVGDGLPGTGGGGGGAAAGTGGTGPVGGKGGSGIVIVRYAA